MSNATPHSRESGERRRRRSRGGKNRNQSQGNRGSHENRQHQSNRSEEFRPQGPRPPRHAPPVKLSWWQKLLQAIGLYKAPAPPPRPERKPEPVRSGEPRPAKSNTRNARTGDAEKTPKPADGASKRRDRGERGESRSRGGDRSSVESARVYVGNLSYDVTEQDLQELFKGIGGVRGVEIVYNRSTHRSKGYGFVEMLHKDEAVRAVEVLHDQHFMGRKMIVSGAKQKGQDEREDSEGNAPEREARAVVVAPVPAAAVAAAPLAEAAAAEATDSEPVIPTIVETVSALEEETPAGSSAEAPAETETKPADV